MSKNLSIQAGIPDSFLEVFEDMQQQFPSYELKTLEEFNNLLNNIDYQFYNIFDKDKKIGYFILFFDKKNNTYWLDYFAIKKDFQSKGYGTASFKLLKKTFPNVKGIFLEVEKEDQADPNTKRRADFYKNIGAFDLHINYLFPTKSGALPMDLYFLPFSAKNIDKITIINVIKNTFAYIHQNVPHSKIVYENIKNLI